MNITVTDRADKGLDYLRARYNTATAAQKAAALAALPVLTV